MPWCHQQETSGKMMMMMMSVNKPFASELSSETIRASVDEKEQQQPKRRLSLPISTLQGCPIFMLDEHDGVVSAEPRNEDEDFRLAVQQLLASDDRDDDENTVTGRVQTDEEIESHYADGDDKEKRDPGKENCINDEEPSQNAAMSACLQTFQAAQAEMSQLINLIDLSRGEQFVSVERVTKTLPQTPSVTIKELVQQRSRHLVRAANLLHRRTQHLQHVAEKQWMFLQNLQSVRKAWRVVATSRGKIPVALRLGDPIAVDVAYADEPLREVPLSSNYLWGCAELTEMPAFSSCRRPLNTIEVTVRCLKTDEFVTIRAPRVDLEGEGDKWKSMISYNSKFVQLLLNEQHNIRYATAFRRLQKDILDHPFGGHRLHSDDHPVAPEAVRIENDCIVLSLDDMYQVSFYLAPQKEEEGKGNNLTEDVTKEKDENDKMDIDDDIQLKIRRPLEGIARYAMLVLIYCGECSHLSPARLLADSLRHYILQYQVSTSLAKVSSEASSSLGIPLCSYWSVLDSMAESIPNVLKPLSKRHLCISGITHLQEFLRNEIAVQVLGHLQSMAIALLLPCNLKPQAASLRVLSKSPLSELEDEETSCIDVYFQCGSLPICATWSVRGGKLFQQLIDQGLIITNSTSGSAPVEIALPSPVGTIVDTWKVAIQCMMKL